MTPTDFIHHPLVKRFAACIFGSLVLALMVGDQEGSRDDFGLAFREAVLDVRVFVFLAIGTFVFLAITFWPLVKPYLRRPGVVPLLMGAVTVLASQILLHWDDAIGTGKFGSLANAVGQTGGIGAIAKAFFGWLYWVQLVVIVIIAFAAMALRQRPLLWVAAVLALAAGAIGYEAHQQVLDFTAVKNDHALGPFGLVLGYLAIAAACVQAALASDDSTTRVVAQRIWEWRPGFPLAVIGLVATLLAMLNAGWFSPQRLNSGLSQTHDLFEGTGLASIGSQYLAWLAWVLLAITAVTALAASYLRNLLLGAAASIAGLASVVLTLITMYDISDVGANLHVDSATGPWQNLGDGGWLACIGFSFMAIGGFLASSAVRVAAKTTEAKPDAGASESPSGLGSRVSTKTLLLVGLAVAIFFPPTMTQFWQKVLVTEIGVYVLLAIGLNVVVGWAGLLDLGYIAFYAIGSYVTAYLVGSLPHKPPDWLHMSPLWAIPFAIAACLIAGIALGAPTLRLRGDYLAIVTLGFGEIIRIIAVNNPGNITNSTRGPSPAVPHPVLDLGFISIHWSQNNLQYWYLLLVIIIVVVILFYRLEGSRLGRAWAAIREDEVAAQATGINTTKAKLLAFAIGASTSGLAGVFFASQVGYFNPDNFVLNNSILVVAYVVFGGMGSLPGAIAGAAVLTWLPEFLKDQVPADDRQMWIGLIVLLMMIFRPGGLIPAKRRKAELAGLGRSPSAETFAVPAAEGL